MATDMLPIPGSTFAMGSNDHYPEEGPVHAATVDSFSMGATTVTNRQFARFVEATSYVTVAERPLDPGQFADLPPENLVPGSLVFLGTPGPVDLRHISQWWRWVPGASWHRPEGPGSGIDERLEHPVVHVAYEDAVRYAAWAGQELPTEAEWELAARGGLDGRAFTWGDDAVPDGRYLANFWQGDFPWHNAVDDGFAGTAPVRSFPPNGYGLYDMAGNVWEWTADWYRERRAGGQDNSCCASYHLQRPMAEESLDPAQPQFAIPRKVVKGGSFLCADNYCQRYRPAARRPQMIDTGMSHIGFRTIERTGPKSADVVGERAADRPTQTQLTEARGGGAARSHHRVTSRPAFGRCCEGGS